MLNAGTLRLDDVIKPGPISNYQLESIFLFSDETRVINFKLTGARLREVLEHGVADGSLGKGPFLQVSGVAFTYDPAATTGQRIVGNLNHQGGGPIRPTDTLTVAFPVYPACEGGDGYDGARGEIGMRQPGIGATRGGPADGLHLRFDGRNRGDARGRADQEGDQKHKSRLSVNSPGPEP